MRTGVKATWMVIFVWLVSHGLAFGNFLTCLGFGAFAGSCFCHDWNTLSGKSDASLTPDGNNRNPARNMLLRGFDYHHQISDDLETPASGI
jgi:hypothetical protein